jgi:hypothetical protein
MLHHTTTTAIQMAAQVPEIMHSMTSQKYAIFVLNIIKLMKASNLLLHRFLLFGARLSINEFVLLKKIYHLMFQSSCLAFY